tara:strand:- start:3223 stop:3552 length:330 start_codon:yes stop_codon:yes gene_type:complete
MDKEPERYYDWILWKMRKLREMGEIEEDGEARPDHYSQKDGSVECIKVIEQLCEEHQNDPFTDYNRYQAFKYLWRLGKKDDVLYDIDKAITFLTFAKEALEKKRGMNDE